MDSRYPPREGGHYGSSRSQRNRSYQESQGGYWEPEEAQQDEDPQLSGPQAIDPQLQYGSEASPTILPPGTSMTNYSGFRPAAYPGYGSSSSSSQTPYYQQPPGSESFDYSHYEFGGVDAASSYPQSHSFEPEPQPQESPRPPPEKKYLCGIEGCNRGAVGHGFTTLNDLERHGRSKHGDDGQYIECRHHDCPDRGKRFPRRDNFVDHYWRVHGNGLTKDDVKPFALEKAKEWMVVKQAGSWSQR